MKLVLPLLALLALAGCASNLDVSGTAWGKPGAQAYQTSLDELECGRGAADAGWTPDLIVGGLVDVARVVVEERARTGSYNGCMTAKGYTRKG